MRPPRQTEEEGPGSPFPGVMMMEEWVEAGQE